MQLLSALILVFAWGDAYYTDVHCIAQGELPAFVAALDGEAETVEALVHLKANINECNPKAIDFAHATDFCFDTGLCFSNMQYTDVYCVAQGELPIFVAASNGEAKTVKALVQLKANINECNQKAIDFKLTYLSYFALD